MDNYRQVKRRFLLVWRFVPKYGTIRAYIIYSLFPNYFTPQAAVDMYDLLKRSGIGRGVVKNDKYYYQKLK